MTSDNALCLMKTLEARLQVAEACGCDAVVPAPDVRRLLKLLDRMSEMEPGMLTSDERAELTKFRRKQAILMASGIDVNGRTFSDVFGWCSHQRFLTSPCDECEALITAAFEKWGHP